MNIVLVEPEIPQNAGNIVRTCAATGVVLHMVKPLGFSVEDKYLKRAGLDYWTEVEIYYYDCFEEVLEKYPDKSFFYSTTKAKKSHSSVVYPKDSFIVFGRESKGLPEKLIADNMENAIRIPMRENLRSLNLANSVAVVLYEALRQNDYLDLLEEGKLTEI